MDSSRTWLAVALCCLVWFGYMRWYAPVTPPPGSTTTTSPSAGGAGAENKPQSPAVPLPTTTSFAPATGKLELVPSIKVNTGKAEITLSDNGGKISEVSLSGYRQSIEPHSPFINLVDPAQAPYEFATLFSEAALAPLGAGAYARTGAFPNIQYSRSEKGVSLVKDYHFNEGSYVTDATYTLVFPPGDRNDWGYLLVPVGASTLDFDKADPLKSWELVVYQNDKLTRKATDSLKKDEEVLQGNTSWIGFGNRYFSTALVNQSDINPDVVLSHAQDFTGAYLRYPLRLKPGQTGLKFNLKLYAGPKDYTDLSRIQGMRQLIDYGTFSFLAYPLLELLRFFYKFVHNYGVAIILLTLLVRLIFYPLQLKSYKSMKAMQKLQPQLTALKEKYKDDMQRFNQEQIALFKTHKVNPMGGCLPMLVQLPVFIALYAVLGNSIELFHAPFMGWIQDLSSKDPYYIFPVLMGISMLLQQKMTPNVGMDPAQAKMMYLMPVIFTFVMLKLPSGLTIYIFLSTILGVLQQLSMNKEKTPPVGLTPAPAGGTSKS